MYPGAIYHVTQRGVGRTALFRDATDRQAFLWYLGRSALRGRWQILAYCLMENHVHLLIRDLDADLPRGLAALFGSHSARFNSRHGRFGALYQGRYRAFVITDERYMANVLRYVLMNPVKARIVTDPGDWPWSSFAATAGSAPAPAWLAVEATLEAFQGNRRFFSGFVRNGVEEMPIPWGQIGKPM